MKKGNALVEFIIVIPVIIILWIGIVNLSSIYLIKQRLAIASRYGAWLVKDGISEEYARSGINEYLAKTSFLNMNSVKINTAKEKLPIFYMPIQDVVEIEYRHELLPSYFPAVKLKEKCAITGGSWRIKDAFGRKEYYKDKIKDGSFNPENELNREGKF